MWKVFTQMKMWTSSFWIKRPVKTKIRNALILRNTVININRASSRELCLLLVNLENLILGLALVVVLCTSQDPQEIQARKKVPELLKRYPPLSLPNRVLEFTNHPRPLFQSSIWPNHSSFFSTATTCGST